MGKGGTVFICMAGSQQAQAKSGGWSLQDQLWSQQSFLKPPFNRRSSYGACLLSGVDKLWGTGWRDQGQVVEKDRTGFIATHLTGVAAITAGPSTSSRHCMPHFSQN